MAFRTKSNFVIGPSYDLGIMALYTLSGEEVTGASRVGFISENRMFEEHFKHGAQILTISLFALRFPL